MRRLSGLLTLIAAAGTLLTGAPANAGAQMIPVARPVGYLVVASPGITAPNGLQTFVQATCPPTRTGVARYPYSGGVFITTGSVYANVNSSFPDGTSWDGYVNNASGADTIVNAYAVCAVPRVGYTVVAATGVVNPAGTSTYATVQCPAGTRVVGGGALSWSQDLAVNINSSFPFYPVYRGDKYSWNIKMNNGSAHDTRVDVQAVCSSYPLRTGYQFAFGSASYNPAHTQTTTSVGCPSPSVPLGGGIRLMETPTLTSVNLNSTFPISGGWEGAMDNASENNYFIQAVAICSNR